MDKIEQEIRQDDDTLYEVAKKLELVSNNNMAFKEEPLQKFVAKDVIKKR